ncbi:MAG TPA: DUF11 domain-containing protein [Rudaea sp.]|jgi:uncharacterized repeat protein (TIGR01451 family)|nr:DUF11 domain-containing protein [Rudaea sp.]
MRKLSWLFGAAVAFGAAAVGITLYNSGMLLEIGHDNDVGPPDGDYWAIRAGVASTKAHIDPLGLVKAAQKERAISVATPAGLRTYSPQKAQQLNSPLTLDADHFINLGPQPENNTQQSFNHVSGRVNWIAVDPVLTEPGNIVAYAGTDGGGIWKTVNCCSANTTWDVKTDFPEIASMSISDVTIDPNNHNVVYGATGDLNYGSFSFGAAGVLKSTDQGETWTLLGAEVFTPFYAPAAGSFPQYQAIGKIRIDPNNSNTVIAGTKTGLYFSYDAGNSWSGPCYTNQYTAGATPQRQDITGLLPIDNGDGTTRLYAVVGTRGIATPTQPDLGNQGANGVYRMPSMPASGCPDVTNWTLLNSGWPTGTGDGVAGDTLLGRIEIAYAPSNPLRMYAEAQDTGTRAINSIYRTDDGGDHWTMTTGPVSTMGCEGNSNNGGAQMWYDAGLTVDPNNPDRVFMSTIDLTVSQNGAASFFDVTCGYGNHGSTGNVGQAVHVDDHARAYVGNDSTQMLVGSDGGVYYTNNADSSVTASNAKNNMNFIAMNDSISSIEFYFGDITSGFATSATPAIGAGAQDNGCSRAAFAGTPTGPVLWDSNCSGDGTVTKIEPVFNQIWFNSSQNGSLARSTTGGVTGFATASANTGGTWGGDPVSSIFGMSYDIYKWGDTGIVGSGCDTTNGCNHMIAGTTRLWETTQATVASSSTLRSSWKARTVNLTKNDLLFANGDLRSYINYVAYSFSDPGTAIVGTNDGNVQIVFGLGGAATANCVTPGIDANCANAVNVTGGNTVLPNRPIQGVRFDPTTNLVAYAAVGGFNANVADQDIPPNPGDPPSIPGHVFRVTCTANCATFTWEDKTGNLPDIPAQQVMPNPNLPAQVFVGTDWGLYYTDNINDAVPTWHRFEGLPHVMVWELVVDRGFTTLAAFTRARGAWVWPLPNSQLGASDVSIAASGPATANAGDTVSYTITVSAGSPTSASNVVVDDPAPAGLTFVSNSGDCVTAFPCQFATINVGESKTITATFKISPDFGSGTLSNTVTVASAGSDPNPANNSATVDTTVSVSADVSVTETVPVSVDPGTSFTFTTTVTNNGTSAASDVSVSNTLPSGLGFVANSGDCSGTFPCAFGSLEPGATKTITTTVCVSSPYTGSDPFALAANVTASSPDSQTANNAFSANVAIDADVLFANGFEACQ